jgi:trimeric autotransporter adhesin
MGTTAGSNSVTAAVTGLTSVVFSATGTAGAATTIVKSVGDGQSAAVSTVVAVNPGVIVRDAHSNAVAGVTVNFSVTAGGGSIASASAVTASNGTASCGAWTLGASAGGNSVTAAVTGLSSVVFTATGTTGAADSVAPSNITDLAATALSTTSIGLTWTAPGDDGTTGTATTYEAFYSTSAITSGNYASANPAIGEPTPQVAGTAQSMTITGLSGNTTYYVVVVVRDDAGNLSAAVISNVATATTSDTIAPSNITDLAATALSTTSIGLAWTAPGDDGTTGTATSYEAYYSTSPITSGNYISATPAVGEPTPQVAGTTQGMSITGLMENTTYYLVILVRDDAGNASAAVISNVATATTPTTPVTPPSFSPQGGGGGGCGAGATGLIVLAGLIGAGLRRRRQQR